jgi:hypothetical protein
MVKWQERDNEYRQIFGEAEAHVLEGLRHLGFDCFHRNLQFIGNLLILQVLVAA